jgi:hypothetical protein
LLRAACCWLHWQHWLLVRAATVLPGLRLGDVLGLVWHNAAHARTTRQQAIRIPHEPSGCSSKFQSQKIPAFAAPFWIHDPF